MSLNAWSYTDVAASVKWADGTDNAVVTSDAADGIKTNQRKVGIALTEGTRNNFAANPGEAMATFNPASSKPGTDASAMIEYSVKMKKGVTFTLTSVEYDAIKQGTDGASYHWSYTVDGVEATPVQVSQDDLLRDNNTTGSPALHHTHEITATAGQTVSLRFYVSGFNAGKLFCLSDVQINGTINGEEEVRTFTDFKIDFRSEEPTVVLPEGGVLPSNVSLSDLNYHGNQHGIQGGTITVNVDGPVKFTLGGCSWGNGIAISKNGEALTTIDNKVGCDNSGVGSGYTKFVTWTYNVEEAATLSFAVNGYLPYFFAEACDFVPQVEVRYFDTDGKTLIGEPQIVDGGSALAYAYGAEDVTVAEGEAFRGWFNAAAPTATKVAEDTPLTEDLSLYAKATDVEIAEVGKIFNYDLTKNYFYQEDHETVTANNGSFHDGTHGWYFNADGNIQIQVAGNAIVNVTLCTYSETGDVILSNGETEIGRTGVVKNGTEGVTVTPDGTEYSYKYTGEATTLTLSWTAKQYIHKIVVYNVLDFLEKDEATGYFMVPAGDVASFLLALVQAESGDKSFLPNGIYDLGETCLTTIAKDNIALIGQSMEGVIIKNAPDAMKESIDKTATIKINKNVKNTYLQDLTIQNALDYYKNNNGRAVALWDQGTQTVCKNVRLLSYQDTYYSNLQGAVKYFEDCEIHGTVDFICGDGSVYFKNNLLYCEKRNSNGGGSDALTANNGPATDKGYVFESCTVKSECPTVSFGRAWNNKPSVAFLNTLVDYSAGEFGFESADGKIARWTKELMNANAWPQFGEYNTHLADGTVLTPASNVVTFVDTKSGNTTQNIETVLSADAAAVYTMEYTLGAWAETAKNDATQAVAEDMDNIDPNGIYLIECKETNTPYIVKGIENWPEGCEYTIRKANARGGFGYKAGEEPKEGIDNTAACNCKVEKIVRDGQVIIVRDGREYNALGAELK